VLNNLLPLLAATEPQQLSLTLNALANGLRGRGTEVGQTLVQLGSYLRALRPHLPDLDRDIAELAKFARTASQASPDLVQALHDFAVVSRTVYQQRGSLMGLFSAVTTASDNLRSFLDGNSGNIISLSRQSTASLQILARYSPEFPCTLRALVESEPNIDRVLGKDTGQPGLHVHINVVPSLGKYVPGRNAPFYGDDLGPHCYSVPFRGITLNDGAGGPAGQGNSAGTKSPGHPATRQHRGPVRNARTTSALGGLAALGGSGPMNSPQENELINELAGLALRQPPRSLPDWSSLLVGPVYRGTAVTLMETQR
jgi:phospholipid/cholesterol/gamma-HCH transport system substrate-binding protein